MNQDTEHSELPQQDYPRTSKQSPIWQELVIELFFQPRKFFSDLSILLQTKYVIPVTWIYGIANSIDRLDQEMLEADLGSSANNNDLVFELMESWLTYWGFVLTMGAVSGLFLWWVGGWWYRKRLEWSGAIDPDERLVRVIYVYASFILAAPIVISSIIQTIYFDNYIQAYNSDEMWSLLVIIFPFWSLITSYIGIRTNFEVSKWKARTWFVILPGILYFLAFGAIIALLGFAE